MLDADYVPIEASPDAPGPRFSVIDRAAPDEIVASLTTHVSRAFAPGSRDPFRLSHAGLRTDQEGFGFNEVELTEMVARSFAAEAARAGLEEEETL